MLRYVAIGLMFALCALWSCSQPPAKEQAAQPAPEEKKGAVDMTGLTTPGSDTKTAAVETGTTPKTAAVDIVDHPSKLQFPPLVFEPPKAEDYRVKLASGMILCQPT
jgi:hypothetical protein